MATLDAAKDVVHVIRTSAYTSYANADEVLPETRIPKPEFRILKPEARNPPLGAIKPLMPEPNPDSEFYMKCVSI